MKKIFTIVLFVMCLVSCNIFDEKSVKLDNGLFLYYNEKSKTASVSHIDILTLQENYEVTIPEKFKECVIKELGYDHRNSKLEDGLHISFHIENLMYTENNGNMTVNPFEIKIYLNKYISQIYDIKIDDYCYIEGEDVCYKIDCYFIIPENNETYYSNNGNIYRKDNDELVYKRWCLE